MKNKPVSTETIVTPAFRKWKWMFCLFLFLQYMVYGGIMQDSLKQPWISVNGYVKDLQGIQFTDDISTFNSVNLVHNRLNFRMDASAKISAKIEIRNRIFYGDLVKESPGFGQLIDQYNGYTRLSNLWVDEDAIVIHSVLDRAFVQYETEKWNVRIGRQRINWGIANIWNPNDIFNAYNLLDFDYEERPGNDAVRVHRTLSDSRSIEAAYKPDKNKNESIGALMYRFNSWKYDFQLLAGWHRQDVVSGLGWAGSIGDTGFKGEISYFYPRFTDAGQKSSLAITLMADRTFPHQWYVSAAFLYNGAADKTTWQPGNLFNSNISAKNIFPYPYSYYVGVVKTFSPITSLNFSMIYAHQDRTLIILPSFVCSLTGNLDFDITLQSFNGRVGQVYKNQSNGLYMRWRWSF